MDSKSSASIALFLSINLVFFAFASACGSCSSPSKPQPIKPTPTSPIPAAKGTCPRDALKLGVCANVLKLVSVSVGTPPYLPCCSLIKDLADLEAAACLCTAIKAKVLGINLNVPVSLSLILNNCGKKVPTGFKCA
ncbi:PREDICTED: 14 kDa proline-rich protein DC2.15 [Nelumbo nucifera]|uniref:Bifunctional inhibitor/plant lipid transfer protein/seed storage helical domain-containing protein n=2 Tax=Nelumbo nucifera TaxID=4432 RepID=A0A822ZSH7_NELNU|nr:PREDICTED: 14 kDa proline-rich protein DC2.15 [Nelumbo nucifera]DAD47823.1 TPA_asm: hypothetical protein HUJ06_017761 [Nelumbo nucifera]